MEQKELTEILQMTANWISEMDSVYLPEDNKVHLYKQIVIKYIVDLVGLNETEKVWDDSRQSRQTKLISAYNKLDFRTEFKNRPENVESAASILSKVPGQSISPQYLQAASEKTTRKQLEDLSRKARALASDFASIQGPALIGLCHEDNRFSNANEWLASLADAAERAKDSFSATMANLEQRPDIRVMPEIKTKGQPRKKLAEAVAILLALDFQFFTGQKATIITDSADSKAKGPFLDFVRDIFSVLEIDASPEAETRKSLKSLATLYGE